MPAGVQTSKYPNPAVRCRGKPRRLQRGGGHVVDRPIEAAKNGSHGLGLTRNSALVSSGLDHKAARQVESVQIEGVGARNRIDKISN
jgi:hypothetical protein